MHQYPTVSSTIIWQNESRAKVDSINRCQNFVAVPNNPPNIIQQPTEYYSMSTLMSMFSYVGFSSMMMIIIIENCRLLNIPSNLNCFVYERQFGIVTLIVMVHAIANQDISSI